MPNADPNCAVAATVSKINGMKKTEQAAKIVCRLAKDLFAESRPLIKEKLSSWAQFTRGGVVQKAFMYPVIFLY